MKKLLFLASSIFITASISAQTCTPNPDVNELGFFPNPLPTAFELSEYNEVITFFVPRQIDGELVGFPGVTLTIGRIGVTDVTNVAQGLSYIIFDSNGNQLSLGQKYDVPANPGFFRGCVNVFGTPQSGTATPPGGDSIKVDAIVDITNPFPVSNFPRTFYINFEIKEPLSAKNFPNSKIFGISSISPNPATNFANITFNMEKSGNVNIRVTDILGKQIESIVLPANIGQNIHFLDVNSYKSGIYFYTITFEGKSVTKKLVVN